MATREEETLQSFRNRIIHMAVVHSIMSLKRAGHFENKQLKLPMLLLLPFLKELKVTGYSMNKVKVESTEGASLH